MAEALARSLVGDGSVTFTSAGTYASVGEPATSTAVEVTAELGVDVSHHRATALDHAMRADPDEVYVMTARHLADVRAWYPELADRVELLDPEGRDILDPYGLDAATYREARDHIIRSLEARFG